MLAVLAGDAALPRWRQWLQIQSRLIEGVNCRPVVDLRPVSAPCFRTVEWLSKAGVGVRQLGRGSVVERMRFD